MTIRTIASLPALLGGYGKHGAGCFCGTSTSSAFAMNEITREDFMKTPSRLINMNQLGDALTLLRDPPVMSLYVYHSNPASVSPDQNRVLAGLSREELFTVVHERFMTDTAVYADIVLPATSSLEHSDLYRSYGHYCIQRAKPAIKPVGESLSNLETFSRLAECMGFEEPFFRMTSDDLIDHLLSIPSPLRQGIDTQKLKAGFGVRLSKPAQTGVKFATSSGKIEILNLRLEEPLPRYFEPRSAVKPYQYCLISAPALYGLNSSFFEREDLCAKQGMMRLMMNQEDAASSGLIHGAMVSAWNDKGNVTFILETTDRVPGGVVVAEGVYWMKDAPGRNTVNALTSQDLTDLGRGSTFYDAKVNVTGL
jgi:anaerobic selenocysteine-containing dehydrogenase